MFGEEGEGDGDGDGDGDADGDVMLVIMLITMMIIKTLETGSLELLLLMTRKTLILQFSSEGA